MKFIKSIILITITLCVYAQEKGDSDQLEPEMKKLTLSKIDVYSIHDIQNDREYELYIKLPDSYSDTSGIKYPVIYYTDAMWHVEILSGSAEYIMENAILVGISWQLDMDEKLKKEAGDHVSRYRDYSFKESSNASHQAKYQFGQAQKHLDFIRGGVFPYIEDNYVIDPKRRTYFGYSLGAGFGSYILLKSPDTFKNYILGSPSLKGDIEILQKLEYQKLKSNVFISYGSLEKELGVHAETFISMLKDRNDESLNLNSVVIDGSHQTAFPMTAVQGIKWVSGLNNE